MLLVYTLVSSVRAQPGKEARELSAQPKIQNVNVMIPKNQLLIMDSGIVTLMPKVNGSAISSVTKKKMVLTHH